MKRVGVILSGCGHLDGAEIREAVLTLLSIDRASAEAVIMAPGSEVPAVNHLTSEESGEKRNVLVEAARIARGQIKDVAKVRADELDAVVLPGGYGAAKNLSTFATEGSKASVHPAVEKLLRAVHEQKKPIGAICIAPAVIARLFGSEGVQVTIGNDPGTAAEIEKCGARHVKRAVNEVMVDDRHKVVTTPAYMYGDERLSRIAEGIDRCVKAVLEMA